MKRRLVSLMLAAFMVLALVPVTASADDTDVGVDNQFIMQFEVDKVTVGNDDESVEISISVDRNGGFAAMNYQLVFDKNAFVLESQPKVNPDMGFEFVPGPLDATANDGKHLGMLTSAENIYTDGVLVTYTFKIAPEAAAGVYNFRLITDGVANLPDGETINLEILDDNFVKMQCISDVGTVTIPGYKVTYDANGGTGAPAAQTKSKNNFVYVSSVIPERDGYKFLGWATSASAVTAEYVGGNKYTENADVTLYAVWERLGVIAGTIDLTAGKVDAKAGDEIEVPVSIANNTGVNQMQFRVVFDDTRLEYVTARKAPAPVVTDPEDAQDYNLYEFMFIPPNPDAVTNSMEIALSAGASNLVGNGEFLLIKFKVLDTAEDGLATVELVPNIATKFDGSSNTDADYEVNAVNGGVEISSQLLGDVNLDGSVDLDDAILVLQYSMFPDDYPIEYRGGVDFTKDGSVDLDDAILLLQYSMFPEDYPIA